MEYEAFLDRYDGRHAEWVDGEVTLVPPESERHQSLLGFLACVLQFLAEHDDAGRVLIAPFQVRLPEPLRRGREPDILFIAREHLGRLRPTYFDGAPDLAVEIVSPESLSRDRGDKFVEYEQAGVPEYWLLDPDRRQAELYRLGPDGRYQLVLGGAAGAYTCLALPRLRLQVEWLWREPLPKVAAVLRELDV